MIYAHSWRVVHPTKNFLGASGVGVGKGQGSGMGDDGVGEGFLRGEAVGVGSVWDGPACVSTMTSVAVSDSD